MRLKRCLLRHAARNHRVFNTKKVRLKRIRDRLRRKIEDGFQYQKGAIKTVMKEGVDYATIPFQYQKGAIKTRTMHVRPASENPFSIPKRCD